MREYKFRVWNDFIKKYETLQEVASRGDIMPRGNELKTTVNYPIIIEQFTGLKDKNGVEIYEGDVVKLIDSNNKILECTVEYITGSFWYVIQHNQLTIGMWEYHNFINKSVEVIGNIHDRGEEK